jgi:hypothetical protein
VGQGCDQSCDSNALKRRDSQYSHAVSKCLRVNDVASVRMGYRNFRLSSSSCAY